MTLQYPNNYLMIIFTIYGYGYKFSMYLLRSGNNGELLSDRMQINDMENDMNAVWLLQRNRIAESIELNK